MDQQNPLLQQLNGQQTPVPQQMFQQQHQQPQEMDGFNSLGSSNWRNEVTEKDRNHFVGQLSKALKQLSPLATDNQALNVASNFEASLYHQCTSKNQYVMAYARKFQDINEKVNAKNNMQQQLSLQLSGISLPMNTTESSPQLKLDNFQPPMDQQASMMARPQVNYNLMQQGRPPRNLQNTVQSSSPAQMLVQQRAAVSMPITSSNAPQGFQIPTQQPQVPTNNLYQNMQAASSMAQAQQYQMHATRQMALQLQQQQRLQNQYLAQQLPLQQNNMSHGIPQPMMFSAVSAASSVNTPTMTHGVTYPGTNLMPQTLFQQDVNNFMSSSAQTGQQIGLPMGNPEFTNPPSNLTTQQQPAMMRQTSQQAQQAVNQEFYMQRLQQQHSGNIGSPHVPMVQQNMVLKPIITSSQREATSSMITQLDNAISAGRVRGNPIENLSQSEKQAIRELMEQMKVMYDKIDHVLPLFLGLTNNTEAARRLIFGKYMFLDQWEALEQDKYLFNLENLHKLREQFNGYFTWVRNVIDQQRQQQMIAQPQNYIGMQAQAMALLQRQAQQNSSGSVPHQPPPPALANKEMTPSDVPLPPATNTPVVNSATGSNATETPVVATAGIKRGGINLQLPPTAKKQRQKVQQQEPLSPQQLMSPSPSPSRQQVSPPQLQKQLPSKQQESPESETKKEVEAETDIPFFTDSLLNDLMKNGQIDFSLQQQTVNTSEFGNLSGVLKDDFKDEIIYTATTDLFGNSSSKDGQGVVSDSIPLEGVGADTFNAFDWGDYNDLVNFD